MPFGVNMKLHSVINQVPQVFQEIDKYNFGKIYLKNDFAMGVGHCLKITFEVPDSNKEYGKTDQDGFNQNEFSCLAIPIYDGYAIKDVEDLNTEISKLSNVDIKVMNDFDIPWVNQTKNKFPKVPKRKVRKERNEDDSDDDGEEEGEDDEEDEEDEDEEEEDDDGSNSGSGNSNSASKKSE
jgi:hypothetical protein